MTPPLTTALVTGASSGIGVAIAGELARRGHALTLVARRADRLRELADRSAASTASASSGSPSDLTDAAERDRIPAEVAARGQVVDVLVNDAGMGTSGRFHELPIAQRDPDDPAQRGGDGRAVRRVRAGHGGARPRRRPQRRVGLRVHARAAAGDLRASKAFVLTFTEALTLDLHGTGVTATALCPGPVKTEFAGIIDGLPSGCSSNPRAWRARRSTASSRAAGRWSPVAATRSTRSSAGTHRARVFVPPRAPLLADLRRTVLITGATGQVGNAIARRLAGDGVEVRALVRSPERARRAAGGRRSPCSAT